MDQTASDWAKLTKVDHCISLAPNGIKVDQPASDWPELASRLNKVHQIGINVDQIASDWPEMAYYIRLARTGTKGDQSA